MRDSVKYLSAFIALGVFVSVSSANAIDVDASSNIPGLSLVCGESVYGAWVTNEGNSVVNITSCGDDLLCGDIVKFEGGVKYNEIAPQDARPLLQDKGPRILDNLQARSDSKYRGRIFNPRNGKSYDSTIKVSESGELKVKGCVGPVCGTKIWTRPQVCS